MDQLNKLKREIAQSRYNQAANEAKKRRLAEQVLGQASVLALPHGLDTFVGNSLRQPPVVASTRPSLGVTRSSLLDQLVAQPPAARGTAELVSAAVNLLTAEDRDTAVLANPTPRSRYGGALDVLQVRAAQDADSVRGALLLNVETQPENDWQRYNRLAESVLRVSREDTTLNNGILLCKPTKSQLDASMLLNESGLSRTRGFATKVPPAEESLFTSVPTRTGTFALGSSSSPHALLRHTESPETELLRQLQLQEAVGMTSDMSPTESVFQSLRAAAEEEAVNSLRLADFHEVSSAATTALLATAQPNEDYIPLGIEEDSNWLSEMHCFLRSEIVEVFYAEKFKIAGRTNAKALSNHQVGIRCRWCVNVPAESRVCRSSAFPSSLRQLYQSFTMMVRDHFGPTTMCHAIPLHLRERLNHLRCSRVSQGASDSKHYWIYAGNKIGMVDTPNEGIRITEESRAAGLEMSTFGSPSPDTQGVNEKPAPMVLLVKPDDIAKTTMFLYTLLLQTQLVHLQRTEQVAKRKTLPLGLEGLGCRHCCVAGRYGFSRRFPLRRRCLPEEVKDIHCHMMRCPLCPREVKELLEKLHVQHEAETASAALRVTDGRNKDPHKEFFDLIWARLGRKGDIKT